MLWEAQVVTHIGRVFAILGVAFVTAMVHSWIVPIITQEPAESAGQADRLHALISGNGQGSPVAPHGTDAGEAADSTTDASSGQTGIEEGSSDGAPPDSEGGAEPTDGALIASITLEQVLAIYREHIEQDTGQVVLIDARGQEGAYARGHIRGAEHMTASMLLDADERAQQLVSMILPEQTIIIYCGGGDCDESKNLRTVLVGELGFANVWIFHPGYPALVEAGLPVVSGETPIG